MNAKMNAGSLIEEADLDAIKPTMDPVLLPSEPEKEKEPVKRSRRKAKPYEQLNQAGRVNAKRKEERAAKRNGTSPVKKAALAPSKSKKAASSKKASRKAASSSSKSKSEQDKMPLASGSGTSKGGVRCRICKKPLTKGTSIQDGMGPECARQMGRLPKGVADFKEHFDSFTVVDEPGKDYIRIKEAFRIANSKGVSTYKFQIAVGGNRMLRPPLNKNFQIIVWKHKKYVPKASVSDAALKELKK